MPGSLKDLTSKMMLTREGVLPSIQAFPPLDLPQIAEELKVDSRAREAGEDDQPPSDGTVEHTAELDIKAEIERRARNAGEEYRSLLDLYEGRIRRAILSTDQGVEIEAAGHNALTDFRIQAVDDLDQLYLARKQVEGREREFNDFRQCNDLTRLPKIISLREQIVRYLLLTIFVLLESILNGMFFAEGSETGLIGGVIQAFVLSLLNIGSAVLYARYGLPRLFHVSRSWKALGAVATALYGAWAFSINLTIAHFRDLYIQDAGQVLAADIGIRLITAPFASLIDSQSWLLAALGLALSILALIDAAGLDDLYPGYGATGQYRENAIENFVDKKASCLAGLTHRRDDAIADMSQVIALIRSAEYELRLAVEGRSRLHQNYCAFLSHLADNYRRLLQQFYEMNRRVRASASPSRFQAVPVSPSWLAHSALPDLPDLRDDTRKRAIERMEYFIRAINQQFEIEVDRYPTVTGLTTRG